MSYWILAYSLQLAWGYEIAVVNAEPEIVEKIRSRTASINSNVFIKDFAEISDFSKYQFESLTFVIDFTQSAIQEVLMKSITNALEIPLIKIGFGAQQNFIFYSENNSTCRSSSLLAVKSFFNIEKPGIASKYSERNQDLIGRIYTNTSHNAVVNIVQDYSVEQLEKLFVKNFKVAGIMNFLFFGDRTMCKDFESAFELSYLNVRGNLALFLDECVYQIKGNGGIAIVNQKMDMAESYQDYILLSLLQYLKVLEKNGLTSGQIYREFMGFQGTCVYSLVNIQNDQRKIIGNVNHSIVTLTDSIYYYGGDSQRAVLTKPTIQISANTGTKNPPGYPDVYQNSKYQKGTYFAVDYANANSKIFENFELVLYDQVDCGVNVFDYEFSKNCFLEKKLFLGISYIPTFYSITIDVLKQFHTLGFEIPVMSGMGSSTSLSSTTDFPMFTRLVSPLDFTTTVFSQFLSIMNWKNVVVFYSDESFGKAIYSILLQNSEIYRYNIANQEKYRNIPKTYNSTVFEVYKPHMQDALDTGCNIFLLAMTDPTPYFWLEGLYDMGVRRNNLTFFFTTITGIDAINSTGGNSTKRGELMHGSFVLYNAAWVGEYGEKIKESYLKNYESAWMPSFYIDTVLTLVATMESLLAQGKCFENKTEFMSEHRKTRLLGASGYISFEYSSNNRNLVYFNLYNFYQDNDTNEWHGEAVGLISPLSTIYYSVLREPVWPGGVFPLDIKRNYLNCPFKESDIIKSSKGTIAKITILSLLFTFSAVIGTFLVIQKSKETIAPLTTKVLAYFNDYLVFLFIFVEALQLLSLGPDFSDFNSFISGLANLSSLNSTKSDFFRGSDYWKFYYIVLCLVFLCYFLQVISRYKGALRLKCVKGELEYIKKLFALVTSSFLVIPVIETTSIFVCDYATSPELPKSYLNSDCSTNCWQGVHIFQAIAGGSVLLTFFPTCTLLKFNWQSENPEINIKSSLLYTLIKNLLHGLLIILEKILYDSNNLSYTIIFLIGVLIKLFFVVLMKPFNFDRANYWTIFPLICIIFNTILCILTSLLDIDSETSLTTQLSFFFFFLFIAIVFQSKLSENLIVAPKARRITLLMKFALGLKDNYRDCEITHRNPESIYFEDPQTS